MTVEIREIKPAEHQAAAELVVNAYRVAHEERGEPFDPGDYDDLAHVSERTAHSDVLVAVVDGELAGCVTYVPDVTSPLAEFPEEDSSGIRMLAVSPSFASQGIGTALVEECIERAKKADKARVVVHTISWMERPQRMYRRLGFERVPERDLRFPGLHLTSYVLNL